jgi:hypothetical protein
MVIHSLAIVDADDGEQTYLDTTSDRLVHVLETFYATKNRATVDFSDAALTVPTDTALEKKRLSYTQTKSGVGGSFSLRPSGVTRSRFNSGPIDLLPCPHAKTTRLSRLIVRASSRRRMSPRFVVGPTRKSRDVRFRAAIRGPKRTTCAKRQLFRGPKAVVRATAASKKIIADDVPGTRQDWTSFGCRRAPFRLFLYLRL